MWVVIRHDDLKAQAVVHVDTVHIHRLKGWVRVSEPVNDKDSLRPELYADAPDLDSEADSEVDDETAPAREPVEQKHDKPAEKPAKTPARADLKEK